MVESQGGDSLGWFAFIRLLDPLGLEDGVGVKAVRGFVVSEIRVIEREELNWSELYYDLV